VPTGAQFVDAARSQVGDPYVYGATGPNAFDCSGLVVWAAKQVGISMPRTSQEQWKVGRQITAGELQPGDLVFSRGSDGTAAAPGHVAIYAGGGQVVVAPHTGANVRLQALSSLSPTGYRRPPGLAGAGPAAPADGVQQTGLLSGLMDIPGEVTDFFGTATDSLSGAADLARAFFQPSTYVRIGAGFFGLVLVVAGLFFLVREAQGADGG
jgi:hypothetical protein